MLAHTQYSQRSCWHTRNMVKGHVGTHANIVKIGHVGYTRNMVKIWSCLHTRNMVKVGHVGTHAIWLLLFVGCLSSQQHAGVSQGGICSDNFTCCHTEIEAADETFYLTQSQYTDTGPTSPNADPRKPGAWQGSLWSAHFSVTGMTRPGKIPDSNPGSSALEMDALTARPTRRYGIWSNVMLAHTQ